MAGLFTRQWLPLLRDQGTENPAIQLMLSDPMRHDRPRLKNFLTARLQRATNAWKTGSPLILKEKKTPIELSGDLQIQQNLERSGIGVK